MWNFNTEAKVLFINCYCSDRKWSENKFFSNVWVKIGLSQASVVLSQYLTLGKLLCGTYNKIKISCAILALICQAVWSIIQPIILYIFYDYKRLFVVKFGFIIDICRTLRWVLILSILTFDLFLFLRKIITHYFYVKGWCFRDFIYSPLNWLFDFIIAFSCLHHLENCGR